MTESNIDLERVIHDPIYRRQVIELLNRADSNGHESARPDGQSTSGPDN